MAETQLLVDPAVSLAKFEQELAEYRRLEDEHLRRGWWILRAEYPEVFVVFASPRLKPPAVIFGALLDFTNYDLWAPSVKLVDPFTREPYKASDLPSVLRRRSVVERPDLINQVPGVSPGQVPKIIQEAPLMMSHSPEDVPFLCLPGVREYHEHPAHTGDSWLLHRANGEGKLFFLLDILYRYGVQPINSFNFELVPQVVGFAQQEPPR